MANNFKDILFGPIDLRILRKFERKCEKQREREKEREEEHEKQERMRKS